MSPFVIAIVTSILAVFVVACGLKLIDIRSSFASLIVKYGPVVACLLGVIAVFSFMLVDTLEILDWQNILLVGVVSAAACGFVRFAFDISRRGLLIPKRAKSRKSGRMSALSIACIFGLDLFSGIAAGFTAGLSFTQNIGTGIIVVLALMMLILDQRINLIQRYQAAHFKRSENIAATVLALIGFPIMTAVFCYLGRRFYVEMGVFMAFALGYLFSWSAFKAVEIVKTLRKS